MFRAMMVPPGAAVTVRPWVAVSPVTILVAVAGPLLVTVMVVR